MSNIPQTITHFQKMREVFVIWNVMNKILLQFKKNTFSIVYYPSFKLVTQKWQKRPCKIILHNLVSAKILVVPSWCACVKFGSAIIIRSYITSMLTNLVASNMKIDLITTYGIHSTIITLLNRFGRILGSKMADHAI
jgi:hypothetical protein